MSGQFPLLCHSRHSKPEPAREIHDMEGIVLLLDRTQPLHVLSIHLLKRRPKQRIVRVTRHIRQVLAVLDPGFGNGISQTAQGVVRISVERLVGPPDSDTRWEDGVGTVGRERRWSPMCEDVGLERIKLEDDQCVLVFLAEFVTQDLKHGSKSVTHEETNDAEWQTLILSITAFTNGSEYCNTGMPSP